MLLPDQGECISGGKITGITLLGRERRKWEESRTGDREGSRREGREKKKKKEKTKTTERCRGKERRQEPDSYRQTNTLKEPEIFF